MQSPSYLAEVDAAINQLTQQKPEIFNFNDSAGSGGYRIMSVGQYYVGVLKNLEAMGLCARFDGEEIQVARTRDFHDQMHIMLSSGHVRRGPAVYRATCYPAGVPLAQRSLPQRGDCALPSSTHVACGRDSRAIYFGEVQGAIDLLMRQRPDLFRGDQVADVNAYYAGVVSNLRAQGFCAFVDDGAEMQVKNTNEFSEHYHILYSWGQVRRDGSYRSSCYPAAF